MVDLVLCHAAFDFCDWVRGSDGLYRCRYCGRLSLRSALIDAARIQQQKEQAHV